MFGDLIPYLESGGDFGSMGGGSHPVPRWPEVRGDTTESGEEPRCAEPRSGTLSSPVPVDWSVDGNSRTGTVKLLRSPDLG